MSPSPSKVEDFGKVEEEKKKGLFRSIYGYLRGPKDDVKQQSQILESKSAKENVHHEIKEEIKLNGEDGLSYDSERGNRTSREEVEESMTMDSEINLSLCLHAFISLEPTTYAEMKAIFERFKVSFD